MIELSNARAQRVAAYLARVVPHGADEATELELMVVELSRRPLPRHDTDLMAVFPLA